MSFSTLLATGSGGLGVRLVIEGLEVQFVSEPSMERTLADGRRRICCLPLMGEGIVLDDTVNIPDAMLESTGTAVRILETEDQDIARVLRYRPSVERYISATIDQAATTVDLLSTAGISVDDVVHVGTEAMRVTGVTSTTLTVTRSYWQTIKQTHQSNVGDVPYRSLTDRPLSIRGRRAYLYLYSDGDDPQGDGTQVWLGQVTANPRLSDAGVVWQLSLGSIAERLKGKIGGDLDTPRAARGIYYSWTTPLRVFIREWIGTTTPLARSTLSFVGFYETQQDFLDALSADLAALATADSLACTYRAVPSAAGWTIEVTVGGSVTDVAVEARSALDGQTFVERPDLMEFDDGSVVGFGGVTAGDRVYAPWNTTFDTPGVRQVPRGAARWPRDDSVPAAATTWPFQRVYLDGPVSADWTAVQLQAGSVSRTVPVAGFDATAQWIELAASTWRESDNFAYNRVNNVEIRPTRLFVERSNLAALRDALVTEGPAFCNLGTAPFLSPVDLASWLVPVVEAARFSWQRFRTLALAVPVELDELLSMEFRMLGLYPVIESDGRIGVRRIEIPNASTFSATLLDDEIHSASWSSMEAGNQTINRWILKTGYDPIEDDWTGPTFTTSDLSSYAQDHTDRPLEVTPWSTTTRLITPSSVAEVALPILSLFGFAHDFITVNVSWRHFTVYLGDIVRFSAHHLPDYTTGQRPVENVVGVVVGRRWALGEAHGTLRLLLSWQNVAGYSPTARVVSQSDLGGDQWTLTVSATLYAPTGRAVASLFEGGDEVRLIQHDVESPTVLRGVVLSKNVPSSELTVQFASTWTPGASTWELCYASWADATASQRARYAYMADADGTIDGTAPRTLGA